MQRSRATILICLGALALLGPASRAARAGTLLVSSTPRDGETVAGNPHWLRLYFRTDVNLLALELRDSEGRRLPLRWGGPEDPQSTAEAFLPDDVPDGGYEVRWKASDARGANEDIPATEWKTPGAPEEGRLRFQVARRADGAGD